MLNPEDFGKGLGKPFADVLPNLIAPKHTCAVKSRIVQNGFNLVHTFLVKVNEDTTLIHLDQSKAFDRVDHCFLEIVAEFKMNFHSCIFLYAYLRAKREVNGIKLDSFVLSWSYYKGWSLLPLLHVPVWELFPHKLRGNPVLCVV